MWSNYSHRIFCITYIYEDFAENPKMKWNLYTPNFTNSSSYTKHGFLFISNKILYKLIIPSLCLTYISLRNMSCNHNKRVYLSSIIIHSATECFRAILLHLLRSSSWIVSGNAPKKSATFSIIKWLFIVVKLTQQLLRDISHIETITSSSMRRHNSDYCDSMSFMIGSRLFFPIYTSIMFILMQFTVIK